MRTYRFSCYFFFQGYVFFFRVIIRSKCWSGFSNEFLSSHALPEILSYSCQEPRKPLHAALYRGMTTRHVCVKTRGSVWWAKASFSLFRPIRRRIEKKKYFAIYFSLYTQAIDRMVHLVVAFFRFSRFCCLVRVRGSSKKGWYWYTSSSISPQLTRRVKAEARVALFFLNGFWSDEGLLN